MMANIVLLNKDGSSDEYSTGRGVRLFTKDGIIQDFFPSNSEKVVLDADFSVGDMVVEPSDGAMLEKVIIIKPSNLLPENIVKDVDIGGIIGSYEGKPGVDSYPDLRYFNCHIDPLSNVITLHGVYFDLVYEATGSYDITIPDKIGNMNVRIACE